MRGKILDINNLEAFIELENGQLTSLPVCEVNGVSIGNHISVSLNNSISPNNHNLSRYAINPIVNNIF